MSKKWLTMYDVYENPVPVESNPGTATREEYKLSVGKDGRKCLTKIRDIDISAYINSYAADAQTLREIKESLQPLIDTSNFRSKFEETFGSLTDDELINSCPSRYVQTASEKMSYLKELALKDKEVRDKAAADLKDKEEKEKAEKENADFQSRLMEIFK